MRDVLVTRKLDSIYSRRGTLNVHTGLVVSSGHSYEVAGYVSCYFNALVERATHYHEYIAGDKVLYRVDILRSRNGVDALCLIVDRKTRTVELEVRFSKREYLSFLVARDPEYIFRKGGLFKDTDIDYSGWCSKVVSVSTSKDTVAVTGKDGEVWQIPSDWFIN